MLDNLFLQIQDSNSTLISIIAIIISSITAIFYFVNLYLNKQKLDKEDNTKYIQLTQNFTETLSELLKEELKLKTKEDCEIYAFRYLEPLDLIAYIKQKNQMPDGITEYFHDGWFAYGLTMMKWYDDFVTTADVRKSSDIWRHLSKWCQEHKISPLSELELPEKMRNYSKLENN